MEKGLTKRCKDAVIFAMCVHLSTRDKRYIFMKSNFKRTLYDKIDFDGEGEPLNRAIQIYELFDKNNMLGSLIASVNSVFDTDLYIELEK